VLHRKRGRRRVLDEEAERAVEVITESGKDASISRLAAAFPPIVSVIVGPITALPRCRPGPC
jgi:hypothetical protein